MATYQGTVAKNDLEGGHWQLRCEDGTIYQLRGGDAGLRVDGQRVSVEGAVEDQAFGIGMTGAYLDVTSWKPL